MAARDANARSVTVLDPAAVLGNARAGGYSPGIETGRPEDWFGPLNPPAPGAPPEVAGRVWDFPSGYNLNLTPRAYEQISFWQMRALADSYDLLRLVIETRKDQACRLEWNINPRDNARASDTSVSAAVQAKIDEITAFFNRPDKVHSWSKWYRLLLEDLFVTDTPTIYRRRTNGGQLYGYEVLDGATIKRVIDDWGRTPLPPIPAYQQILKGRPAVNYTMDDVLYMPHNVRAHKAYGYSAVEQVIMSVNIALRRQIYQLQFYTEGNVPEALIGVPEDWTPGQIAEFQNWWDSLLEGNTAQRRHARFVPGGVGKTVVNMKEGALTNKDEEWLARIICYAFSISPQSFVSMMNRATATTAHDSALEEGLAPIQQWTKEFMDRLIEEDFGAPELSFDWKDDREIDPELQEKILVSYVKTGIMSVNEARDELGDDPVEGGDEPMIYSTMGAVPVSQAAELAMRPPPGPAGEVAGAGGAGKPNGSSPPKPKPNGKTPPGAAKSTISAPVSATSGLAGYDLEGAEGQATPARPPFVAKAPVDGGAGAGSLAKRRRTTPPIKPVSLNRPTVRRATKRLREGVAKVLRKVGKDVAAQVAEKLGQLGKAAPPPDDMPPGAPIYISGAVDLSGLYVMIDPVAAELEMIFSDMGGRALAQIGVDNAGDLVNRVNARAVAWSDARAAELVSMRYNDAGDLVDYSAAEDSIIDATREFIRRIIADGLAENVGKDEIAARIEDGVGFGEERADLIASTEIRRANSQGALEGFKSGRDAGVDVQKLWHTVGDDLVDDEVCAPNEDAGPIDLDEDFPSGDDAPPGHPRCRCVLVPIVDGDEGEPQDSGEE